MKEKALSRFHRQPEPLNCAQAVAFGYQQVTGDSKLSIAELKAFGGGRAPEGLCGALYTACLIAPAKSAELKQRFSEATGSVFCRELKQGSKTPCEKCVAEAADLLESELGLNS
jgi:hypothetical protein